MVPSPTAEADTVTGVDAAEGELPPDLISGAVTVAVVTVAVGLVLVALLVTVAFTATGRIEFDTAEARLDPAALVAVTVKV
jgi:hypothetical protein